MRKAGPPRDIPPPLEMLCLKALWQIGEGNVSAVQRIVAESKPLAYTTIMTVLDRLARRNIVSRQKSGRAYIYAPRISKDSIRRLALKEFVDCFFDGSEEKLADFLRRGSSIEHLPSESDAGMDAALL